jgi:hypothetical protein
MHWARLGTGLLLCAAAGVVIGGALAQKEAALWAMGVLALLLGVVSTLAAVLRSARARVEPESGTEWSAAAAPQLGEMLLNYGLISQADLDRALTAQKGTKKRLGRVLVEMELVTHAQIAEVLEEQLSRREGRFLWGAGQKLVD